MWPRPTEIAARPRLQHARIQAAAGWILLIRLAEGAACLLILLKALVPPAVPPAAILANFLLYALLNLALYSRHRRGLLTPAWVWLDIAANLVPMFAGLYWTGGLHSPLLPVFVLKLPSYGLIYGTDVGLQALAATLLIGAGLTIADLFGLNPPDAVVVVSDFTYRWIRLGLAVLIYATLVGGSLRFHRLAQAHETHLAEMVREKEGLYRRSAEQERSLRHLSRRMMDVSEDTLQRVARDLHDHLGQSLTAVRMEVGAIERALPAGSPARGPLDSVRRQLAALLQTVRDLSQLLRPPVLDDLGLVPALQLLVDRFAEQSGLRATLDVSHPLRRLPAPIEIALYRVAQEALTNAIRHANARTVRIELDVRADLVTLAVRDDGCGFNPDEPPRHSERGTGVIGMRERIEAHGGRLAISSAPQRGTAVTLSIPLLDDTRREVARNDDKDQDAARG